MDVQKHFSTQWRDQVHSSSASIASHGNAWSFFLKSKTGEAVEKGLSSIFRKSWRSTKTPLG